MATKAIPVVAAKVAATLTDFPALVQPSLMTGWGAITLAEAQSIRFYSDEALTTELAREVVSADEIHVKVPSLTTTTTIYADYDGVRADYAVGATYGRNAVWSDYTGVWHLGESSGDAVDSTGNGYDGVDNNTVGTTTGQISNARNFVGANSEYFACGTAPTITDLSISFWYKFTTDSTYGAFLCKRGSNFSEFNLYENNTDELVGRTEDDSGNLTVTDSNIITNTAGTFRHYVWTSDTSAGATGHNYYQNGSSIGYSRIAANNNTTIGTNTNPMFIGTLSNDSGVASNFLNGAMEELRLYDGVRPSDWITTEYNNQSDVGTFWGTVTDVEGGGGYRFVPQIRPFAGI